MQCIYIKATFIPIFLSIKYLSTQIYMKLACTYRAKIDRSDNILVQVVIYSDKYPISVMWLK